MPETSVRLYRPSDRSILMRIAADTAYFGQPIEAYLDDRRIFLDAFYSYYTDIENQYTWVAEADGEMVGFLTGSINARQAEAAHDRQFAETLRKALSGHYFLGWKTINYFWRLKLAGWRDEGTSIDYERYPAHLHINMASYSRGLGLGRKLMEAYIQQLRKLKIPGVHLQTTSYNVAACRLYEGVGFIVIDEKPSKMWRGMISTPIQNRAYGLRLQAD